MPLALYIIKQKDSMVSIHGYAVMICTASGDDMPSLVFLRLGYKKATIFGRFFGTPCGRDALRKHHGAVFLAKAGSNL